MDGAPLHLLGLALAFSHQIATGAPFVGHPVARAAWTVLWVGALGVVVAYRVVVPLLRTARHRPRILSTRPEAPGVVSVTLTGRALNRMGALGGSSSRSGRCGADCGGQAHPYSLSGVPSGERMRITVRTSGDHGAALAALAPGTPVAVEGPYGAFTKEATDGHRVLLAGAGVGMAPVRALLEDLPPAVDVVVLARASTGAELVLGDEVRELVRRRGARLYELLGPRETVSLTPASLTDLVPDLPARDVYVCGPDGFTAAVRTAAQSAGVRPERIHDEAFAF